MLNKKSRKFVAKILLGISIFVKIFMMLDSTFVNQPSIEYNDCVINNTYIVNNLQ